MISIRNHVRTPVGKTLDAAHPDIRIVDIYPGVRQFLRTVQHEIYGKERAIPERSGSINNLGRGLRPHPENKFGDRHGGNEIRTGCLISSFRGRNRHSCNPSVFVQNFLYPVVKKNRRPILLRLYSHCFIHLARAKSWVLKFVDQGLDDFFLFKQGICYGRV